MSFMYNISYTKQLNLLLHFLRTLKRWSVFVLLLPCCVSKASTGGSIRHRYYQPFQFNGELYEQTDSAAMGTLPGPLLANVFTCHIEDQLEQKSMIPGFYQRYVDDTLVTMPNTAKDFLQVLSNVHPSLSFTMELELDGSIPFLGTVLTRCGGTLTTKSTEIQPTQDCYSISKATSTAETRKAWQTLWLTVLTVCLPPKKDLQKNATRYATCFQSCAIRKHWLIPA